MWKCNSFRYRIRKKILVIPTIEAYTCTILILKNGWMKSVNTSNLKSGLEYTSNAKLIEIQNLSAQPNEIIVVLPNNVIEKLDIHLIKIMWK
jgi:hypothetical protein